MRIVYFFSATCTLCPDRFLPRDRPPRLKGRLRLAVGRRRCARTRSGDDCDSTDIVTYTMRRERTDLFLNRTRTRNIFTGVGPGGRSRFRSQPSDEKIKIQHHFIYLYEHIPIAVGLYTDMFVCGRSPQRLVLQM